MKGWYLIRFQLFIFLTLSIPFRIFSQDEAGSSLRMIFYNTENLFDIANDPLTDDDEFLPGGTRRWNYSRFRQKINSVYKVLTAAGGWDPPVLAGFCEIENRNVLETLIYDTYLSKYNYSIIHNESNDPRGIDVGIIYRKDILSPLATRYLIPAGYNLSEFKTRNVLYTKFLVAGDTIHIFLNHWPSRRGGVLAGESYRKEISAMIRKMADSICLSSSGMAKIIVAGDFNCTAEDAELMILTEDKTNGDNCCGLINLSRQLSDKGNGTYKYQGIWEMIDHVIISNFLTDSGNGIVTDLSMFSVFSPDFLLIKDPVYPGLMPFSTYRGYRYQGGFSDHLPVVLDLRVRSVDQ